MVLGDIDRLSALGRAPVQDWLTQSLSFCSGQESAEEAGWSEGELLLLTEVPTAARVSSSLVWFLSRMQAAM